MMYSICFYFILIALPKNTFLFLTASENAKMVYISLYLGLEKFNTFFFQKRPNEQVITCRLPVKEIPYFFFVLVTFLLSLRSTNDEMPFLHEKGVNVVKYRS